MPYISCRPVNGSTPKNCTGWRRVDHAERDDRRVDERIEPIDPEVQVAESEPDRAARSGPDQRRDRDEPVEPRGPPEPLERGHEHPQHEHVEHEASAFS